MWPVLSPFSAYCQYNRQKWCNVIGVFFSFVASCRYSEITNPVMWLVLVFTFFFTSRQYHKDPIPVMRLVSCSIPFFFLYRYSLVVRCGIHTCCSSLYIFSFNFFSVLFEWFKFYYYCCFFSCHPFFFGGASVCLRQGCSRFKREPDKDTLIIFLPYGSKLFLGYS